MDKEWMDYWKKLEDLGEGKEEKTEEISTELKKAQELYETVLDND